MDKDKILIKRKLLNGHYYQVGYYDNKQIEKVKWTKDTYKEKIQQKFYNDLSFKDTISRRVFKTGVIETSNFGDRAKHSKKGSSMNVASVTIGGQTITARSQNINFGGSIRTSRKDAYENVLLRISGIFGDKSDIDEGAMILDRMSKRRKTSVQYGIVNYS